MSYKAKKAAAKKGVNLRKEHKNPEGGLNAKGRAAFPWLKSLIYQWFVI